MREGLGEMDRARKGRNLRFFVLVDKDDEGAFSLPESGEFASESSIFLQKL